MPSSFEARLADALQRAKNGASLTGYGLVVGLISIVALSAVTSSGENVKSLFGEVAGSLSSVSGAGGGSSSGGSGGSTTPPVTPACASETITFTNAGVAETWIVPTGCSNITVKLWGGGGGGGGLVAGGAAFATGTLNAPAGTELHLIVGEGGTEGSELTFNGTGQEACPGIGGAGAGSGGNGIGRVIRSDGLEYCGGGGGGASAIATSSSFATTRLIVAAGGGGGAYGIGGAGGATNGVDGTSSPYTGFGALGATGGVGGVICGSPYTNEAPGEAGADASAGGDGGDGPGIGGGGGGGYAGGGGGGCGYGSGGGSSYWTGSSGSISITGGSAEAGGPATSGSAQLAGGRTDPDYSLATDPGMGGPVTTAGNDGLIVITTTP